MARVVHDSKLLVLGHGFLGSKIAAYAHEEGIQVSGVRRSIPEETSPAYPLTQMDVLDTRSFSKELLDYTHVVYSVSASESTEDAYRKAYLEGLEKVIKFLKNSKTLSVFTFISSTGVYPQNAAELVTEDSPTKRVCGKEESWRITIMQQAEEIVRTSFSEKQYLILRLSGIYGGTRRYLYNAALAHHEDEVLTHDQWTNRIHVDDAARAYVWLMWSDPSKVYRGIYNITDKTPVLKSEVINFIRESRGKKRVRISENASIEGKKISSDKLCETGFTFYYPSYEQGYSLEVMS